jgi:hypothetical protein
VRLTLDTEFSANSKIQAIGSLALPALRYSFGIINWHQEELQNLDRETRKLLTIHGQHHPKEEVDRLYVPRKQGGRGLINFEEVYTAELTKLVEYLESKEDPLLHIVRAHQHINSAMLQTAR